MIYGRGGEHDLLLRLFRPPVSRDRRHALVMVHGGAWSANSRKTPTAINRLLADRGMTVFSLDFRDGRNAKHPCAVQDITAGIRFVRRNAAPLGVDPENVGLIGSSSGGHLVLLAGTQPDVAEHRSTLIADLDDGSFFEPHGVSAAVSYVVALWPVSDPLRRYHHAADTNRPELRAAHEAYYRDEKHMADASVQRMLAAGEARNLPPLAVVQPGADRNVPPEMTLDLLRQYQLAGGFVNYLHYPDLPHAFAYADSPDTRRLVADLWPFIEVTSRTGSS